MADDYIPVERVRMIRDTLNEVLNDLEAYGKENPDSQLVVSIWSSIYSMSDAVLTWAIGEERPMPMAQLFSDYLQAKVDAGAERPSYF